MDKKSTGKIQNVCHHIVKEACEFCDHAVALCRDEGIEYKKELVDKHELRERCKARRTQIFAVGDTSATLCFC